MREYMNYLSHFYDEGTPAKELPPEKRVYTESEMQRALSKALMYHGIYNHLREGEKNGQKEKAVKKKE